MMTGDSTDWADLIDTMVPGIVSLVIDCWAAMPSPKSDDLEDHITERLCRLIKQHRTTRDLPFQVHTQFVELEPANNEKLGRLDIAFIPLINREDYYFCLECKRLNVRKKGTVRSYAAEYVLFGMLRFVSGQYAKNVRHGGMLGYVLDGSKSGAIANVEANIQSNAASLGLVPPLSFQPSAVLPSDPRILQTCHERFGEPKSFCIQHLFLETTATSSQEGLLAQ